MLLLRKQKNLLARIDQPAHREHAVIFADVRIEEDRVAPRINHLPPSRPTVTGREATEHPLRWSDDRTRAQQSIQHRSAIPNERARWPRRAIVHGMSPGN